MNHYVNRPPATIRDWLAQQGAANIGLHHVARALGRRHQEAEALLQVPPTSEALLNLNRLALYHHLALADRVWPHCTWLDWHYRQQQAHPVIRLILDTFGSSLLRYVEQTFGEAVVHDYLSGLKVPPEYLDIIADDEDDDILEYLPDDQMVFNPHLDEDDIGELFVFGSPATAACFRWLIESRPNYSHYVYNRTSYLNDPLGIRLAYDLRAVIQREYWATVPPDTLPAYLAIARALQEATVPDVYQEGRLPPLSIRKVATMAADRLAVVQMDIEQVWVDHEDTLVFDHAPVQVFVLDSQTEQSPAALILTTQDEPGNPELHRQGEPDRYLSESHATMVLAFVPETELDIDAVEEVVAETLNNTHYGLHTRSGTFCISRTNPFLGEVADDLIPIYRIPGGYMLQFNQGYRFTPPEMAVD